MAKTYRSTFFRHYLIIHQNLVLSYSVSYQALIRTIRTYTLTKFLSMDIKLYRLCADRENRRRQKCKALEFQRGKVMILQDSIVVNFTDRTPQVMVMVNMERIILSPEI